MTFFEIATLGCKVNQYESARISSLLINAGWKLAKNNPAQYLIINTCLVTNIAERKSRQMIRKLHKKNPEAKIIILGCYANLRAEQLETLFPGAMLINQNNKTDVENWGIKSLNLNFNHNNIISTTVINQRFRQTLKIQDGCDQYCSYCIIPYARNKLYSRPEKDLLQEAVALREKGVQEIILTGINLGKYKDKHRGLIDILISLSKIGFERIRLSSIEPNLVSDELLTTIHDIKNIMPHLHIPLQSGSDQILRSMNRPYSTQFYSDLSRRVHSAGITITTDLIVGFPGETSQTFQQSYQFMKDTGFSDFHPFKYSPRPGTAASKLKQSISGEEIESMLQKILNLKHLIKKSSVADDRQYRVLFEQKKAGYWLGLSEEYLRFHVISDQKLKGKIKGVKFIKHQDDKFIAEIS